MDTHAFPVDELLPHVLMAVKAHGGVLELAGRMALRFDEKPDAWARQLQRITGGHVQNLTTSTADRLAIGLGMHPCLIWTDW